MLMDTRSEKMSYKIKHRQKYHFFFGIYGQSFQGMTIPARGHPNSRDNLSVQMTM